MTSIVNIDLLSVGIATAGSLILGVSVFLSNRRSATNLFFLLFVFASVAWSIINYLSYQTADANFKLWIIRLVLFSACYLVFFFFMLMRIFPREDARFSSRWEWGLAVLTCLVALFTLSPYVFSGVITEISNRVAQPVPAFGIGIFGIFVVSLIIAGIVALIKKVRQATDRIEKVQFDYLLAGVALMFSLILGFNFFLPTIFKISQFIPFAPVFIFPFIMLTAYAIFKHHLLSVKVVATEIFAFVLCVVSLADVLLSGSLVVILFRLATFVIVLIFSILLIKSVLREVEQREELQILNAKLDGANQQLEELSRFKSQLLSLASHQIRSPLAAIRGFVSLILDGSYGSVDDKAKDAIHKIGSSADSLIDLINTLLDVRKVEEGKMEYQFARTDLTKLVADVTSLLQPLAQAKGLEFLFASPGREVFINADAEKFKQVIQNLVDNAIKYTPSGFVKVEIKEDVSQDPGKWRAATVTVSDSGLGVSEALIPHLFEEFIRDERVKKDIRGTGLGLFIARKIAEAHGGRMWAESGGEGKGSAFHVSVPEIQ